TTGDGDGRGRAPALERRRGGLLAGLLPGAALARIDRRPLPVQERYDQLLLRRTAARDRPCDLARRPSSSRAVHLPDRRGGQLARRPAHGRYVQGQRAGHDHGSLIVGSYERSLSRSSSSARRWARIVFWSASLEITVE